LSKLRTQIEAHAELILGLNRDGISIRAIAERLLELGVHHPYTESGWPQYVNPVTEIGAAVRAWLNARMTPVERLQDRIARLETQLAEAEAELDRLLAQPPPSKVDPRVKWRARNWEIYDRHSAGESYSALALAYSISRERIRQIIHRGRWKIKRAGESGADPEARKRLKPEAAG
jgi:hypothetical protein